MLKFELPWDSQPQEVVEPSHEVFAGTGRIGSWITSRLDPTVIDGRNVALVSSNTGTMSAGVGQGGLGIEGTASSSEQRLSNAHLGIGSTDYWFQITFEQRGYRSLGSGINVLGGYGSGWGLSGAWLYQFSDNKLVATMDGAATTIAMAVALPNGTHTATLFSIGTTAYFYVDGQLIGTTTKSTPSEISSTRFNLCSDISSSSPHRTWNGRAYGAHFGIGTLSQAWAAFASANPWQLFAPRSIWVPVSAGGGGTTISGALGTATASGIAGTVDANRTVAGSVGVASALGIQGGVSQSSNTTVTGTVGVATASGIAGGVDANRTIAGVVGVATAEGLQGTVSNTNDTVVTGSVGTATASGVAGTVAWNRTLAGIVGEAIASGITGGVQSGDAITQLLGIGGWGPIRRRKPKDDDKPQELPEVVEPVAPKPRKTLKLADIIGKRAQISSVDISGAVAASKKRKRQQEDELLLLM